MMTMIVLLVWSSFLFPFQQLVIFGLVIFLSILQLNVDFFNSVWVYQDFMSMILILLSVYLLVLMKLMTSPNWNLTFLLILLTVNLIILFSVDNILIFYILFEFSLVPMSLMILGWGFQPERLSATLYMLFYTISSSFPFLGLIFYTQISSFSEIQYLMQFPFSYLTSFIFVMPFLVKLPMFGVHLWLPKAHVEAPSFGSMILAGVLLKLGGFGIWRLSPVMNFSVIYMGAITFTGASICSIFVNCQTDVKALIAYSSIVHMGLIAFCFIFFSPLALIAGLMMMVAHGVCSSGLFCLMTLSYERFTSRSIIVAQGLLSTIPSFTLFFSLLILMNLSAPPSLNLVSEINMIYCLLSWDFISIIWVGVMIIFSLTYSLTLFYNYFHGPNLLAFPFNPESLKEFSLSFFHSKWWLLSPWLIFLFEIY